jgi:hypothetical protein
MGTELFDQANLLVVAHATTSPRTGCSSETDL